MEQIHLFPVTDRHFADARDFRQYLVEAYDPEEVDNALTVIVGVTKRGREETIASLDRSGFSTVRSLGAVSHLRYAGETEAFETYFAHEDGSGVIVFYTNFRKTEEIPQISSFLLGDEKTYPMFFRPAIMQDVLNHLYRDSPTAEVIEFTARRHPGAMQPSRIRGSIDRTFSYWGRDGRETLSELTHQYGVLPNRVVVEIPGTAKFGVDNRGYFTFNKGDLRVVFNLLERTIEESRTTIRAFDGSSFDVLPIETAHRSIPVPSSTPVQIRLSRRLAYGEVPSLMEGLEEGGYSVIDSTAEEGSLFLSIDLVSPSGHRFRVRASESAVSLLPGETPQLAPFMEFYHFLVDSVDPHAELVEG